MKPEPDVPYALRANARLTGFEEITDDVLEPDFWRVRHHLYN
jgi:hypothetical protein